ncbi:MAG: acetate--CoA ligase [Candidatus Micrarchaeota archaeon]|nr:acetate--CoA ligase [Candidatus Micrarchaeota archaeon]
MEADFVRVSQKKFKGKPNMGAYEKVYSNFKWEDVQDEVESFEGGKLNQAYNTIDKHRNTWRKNKVALYWEGEDGTAKKYTFLEMSNLSNKFANALTSRGIKKGDRVFIFLSRIPENYTSFLGILKMGGVAGTMFAAFGPEAVRDRLLDSDAVAVVTDMKLKPRVDQIRKELPNLKYVFVVGGKDLKADQGELSFEEEVKRASRDFEAEKMNPDDTAFIQYTSGSTGKPKGVMHTHGGMLQQHITAKWVLDLKDDDIYWCTSDPGWITGIIYTILGAWSNGASQVIFDGRFDPDKWYSLIERYQINVWYTAPTALRMLMSIGDEIPKKYNMKSLRHICSVGEPLNPEPIRWAHKVFGLWVHDTWWQTETGSMLICNYPKMDMKIGYMGKPFPGITAAVVDDNGNEVKPGEEGDLALRPGWPSMFKGIWKNEEKFKSYIKNGWYITGDKGKMDSDGYFIYVGRGDDVIKTAGERVGPFEIESALVDHPAVAEAGVIGKPDPEGIRGEIIKAFIVLRKGHTPSKELEEEIRKFIKTRLAGHMYPKEIEFRDTLPRTQSGKIMRRVLKAQELGLPTGDLSTIEK